MIPRPKPAELDHTTTHAYVPHYFALVVGGFFVLAVAVSVLLARHEIALAFERFAKALQ